MELKKHTPEEFESMSEDELCDYEEKLFDLAGEIGLKRNNVQELEASLLNIKELATNKKKKRGHKYSTLTSPKWEQNAIGAINKSLESCKKVFVNEMARYIDDGMLVLSRPLNYKNDYGEPVKIKLIYKELYGDLYDECEYQEVLCCAESLEYSDSIEMHLLPIDVLMNIYRKIVDGDALLLTDEEIIANNIDAKEIKI